MSTRLSKISREHNIGITAIVSFFQTHNIKIEANPNTKISDEQYDILLKALANRPIRILPWYAEPFTLDAETNRKIINSHSWNKIRNDIFVSWENKIILLKHFNGVFRISKIRSGHSSFFLY